MQAILGIAVILGGCWLVSENRREVNRRLVITSVVAQILLALLLLRVPLLKDILGSLNVVVQMLDRATQAGTSMVFGFLGGGSLPYAETAPGASFTLAFRALPLVLVVSALSSLLFYWKILPRIVAGLSWLLQRSLGIGGALGVGAAANIFIGMVESPLLVRPYLARISRGELFALMTCGMSTIAGTVMVLYATILSQAIPDVLGHILTASIISAPAALGVAALLVPHVGERTAGDAAVEGECRSSMDAVAKGTADGVGLLLHIVAMLIVLVALVSLVNQLLGLLPFADPLTLERLLGYLLAPLAWLIGIPAGEALAAGGLLGTKTILNEFVAYLQLAASGGLFSEKSRIILMYALCGFANLGSLGIMVGGMTAMAPERRSEIIALGGRSVVAGTLATALTGAIAGLVLG